MFTLCWEIERKRERRHGVAWWLKSRAAGDDDDDVKLRVAIQRVLHFPSFLFLLPRLGPFYFTWYFRIFLLVKIHVEGFIIIIYIIIN